MIQALLKKYNGLSKQLKVVIWFTFVGFLQKGISIITTPIFTRMLSTDDYGLFNVFNAYYGVIVIAATLYLHMGGINNAFVKLDKTREQVVSSFQSLSLIISTAFFAAAFLFRNQLAAVMKLPVIVVVIMFLAFLFVEPYHIWVIYKRYEFDYKKPVLAAVLISILTPLTSVIAILLIPDHQGIARIASFACVNIILPGLFFYIVNYRKNSTFYDGTLWKYAISFNAPLIIHYLSETLLNQTDRIMINHYKGPGDAGIYSVAFSAASLFTIFSSALNTAFVPWTYQKMKEKDYAVIEKTGYLVLGFLAVILSVMIMFAPEIVRILAGSSYTGAVFLIPTLSASVYFGYMYQLFSRIELYFEKKSYTVISTVTAAIVNILLNAWWIPQFGFTAAGYSTLISHILFCMMHYCFFSKVCKECIDGKKIYDIRKILLISAAVLAIAGVMTLLYSHIVIRLAAAGILFVICFLMRRKLLEVIRMLLPAQLLKK